MVKRISLRQFFMDHPVLDGLRLDGLTSAISWGLTSMMPTYGYVKLIEKGAEPFVFDESGFQPAIFAVYHQRMAGILGMSGKNKKTLLVSQSRDGEIMANVARCLGFDVVRGSTSRRALPAIKELIQAAHSGQSLLFMVDGPRGPIYDIKPGVIRMAEITGLPIVPFMALSRGHSLRHSWDRYMTSHWGTPMVQCYGTPLPVSSATNRDLALSDLDRRMKTLHQLASLIVNNVYGPCDPI